MIDGMATTVFTTYADLCVALKNAIASRDFGKSSATINGNEVSWSSFKELQEALTWAEQRRDTMETGAVSLRVYARNGGRG